MKAALLLLLVLPACSASDAAPADARVKIEIEHSAFQPAELSMRPGQTVTFVIENNDPIDHEFILGDERVQALHEAGRQRHHHGRVPGEISVPAGETRTTTYTFPSEETVLTYACHLPRHFEYGMRGDVEIR